MKPFLVENVMLYKLSLDEKIPSGFLPGEDVFSEKPLRYEMAPRKNNVFYIFALYRYGYYKMVYSSISGKCIARYNYCPYDDLELNKAKKKVIGEEEVFAYML